MGDIVLVVSELVTNADRHGGRAEWVTITAPACDTVRVEVADLSRRLPTLPRRIAPDRPGGHGLQLTLRLADHVGVHVWRHRPGKSVWAEFRRITPRIRCGCSLPDPPTVDRAVGLGPWDRDGPVTTTPHHPGGPG